MSGWNSSLLLYYKFYPTTWMQGREINIIYYYLRWGNWNLQLLKDETF